MPVAFPLPPPHDKRGWKAKIRDRERVEPPHVTILFRMQSWRLGLRERDFLDTHPDSSLVPAAIVDHLLSETIPQGETTSRYGRVVAEWNRLYPENPV